MAPPSRSVVSDIGPPYFGMKHGLEMLLLKRPEAPQDCAEAQDSAERCCATVSQILLIIPTAPPVHPTIPAFPWLTVQVSPVA